MNKQRVDGYIQKIERMSREELEELLYQSFVETPDDKIDFDLIEAIVRLPLPEGEEVPPVDVEASYAAFRDKYAELFEPPPRFRKWKPRFRRLLAAALIFILLGSVAYALRSAILPWLLR